MAKRMMICSTSCHLGYLGVTEALLPVPPGEDRARDRARGRAKRHCCVPPGVLGIRPASTRRPTIRLPEAVPVGGTPGSKTVIPRAHSTHRAPASDARRLRPGDLVGYTKQ
ncbi:hypothetical protein MTO96_033668 [Rhipicephalus appendiculatus]